MNRRLLVTCFSALGLVGLALPSSPLGTVLAAPMRGGGTGAAPLTGTVPGVVTSGRAQFLGAKPASDTVSIAVGLALRDTTGLQALIHDLNDPSSSRYHHYLSQAQANDAFNPTVAQQQQVITWLQAHGLTVTNTYPNHLLVDAAGTVDQVQTLLNISLNRYQATVGGKQVAFFAPDRNPVIDASVSGVVNAITGLDSFPRFHHAFTNGRANARPAYYPQDFANAYDVDPLWNAGYTGAGQHIGITLWGAPASNAALINFSRDTGAALTDTVNGRLHVIAIDGGSRLVDSGEAGLDIEYAGGLAPGATIDYYEAPTDSNGNPTDQGLLDALNTAGTDGNDNHEINNSWGGCEASSTGDPWTASAESIFASNAATGHNYFFASGDNGSWCDPYGDGFGVDPYADYPTDSPNVTSVGGTTFSNNVSGPAPAGYPGESAWAYCSNCNAGDPEGSGGGYSAIFSRPAWQQASTLANNGMRGYPDVSADADPNTGALVCYGNGSCAQFGGTSLASPIWVGITADINQYLAAQGQNPLGFLAADLYSLANGSPAYTPFHDVIAGTNGSYNAGPGWDPVTGLGTPDAWNLARDLGGSSNPPNTPTPTDTPTSTDTPTPTSTLTSTNTPTPTDTPTSTNTPTPTSTSTSTSTPTPTNTPSATATPTQTPTNTPTPTPTSTGNSPVNEIVNGGFESGFAPWQPSFSGVTLSTSWPHSGSYSAEICSFPNCYGQLYQLFTLPSSVQQATLTYWVRSTSQSYFPCTGVLSVQLRTASGGAFDAPGRVCSGNTGWTQYTTDVTSALAGRAGQTVQLYFGGITNRYSMSTWYVDDVSLVVTSGDPGPNPPTSTPTATLPPPTSTPTPTATLLPSATSTPTPTATPTGGSGGGSCVGFGCVQAMVTMLNNDRAEYGVAPLSLNITETFGTGRCVGSYGHSVHMEQMGTISHDQFPADICIPFYFAGENVGEADYGNEMTDLQQLDSMMMAETNPPRYPGCSGSHACNIINPRYRQVGVGIYYDAYGRTWLTEDFTN